MYPFHAHLPFLACNGLIFFNVECLVGVPSRKASIGRVLISIKSSKQKYSLYSVVCKLNVFPITYEITTENSLTFPIGNF